jgi:hypothetical protein
MIDLDAFFDNYPDSRRIFDKLMITMDLIGPAELRVSKSQIVLRRKKDFAWIWIPGRYLKGNLVAPLVLSLNYSSRDPSNCWKEIVEPYPGRFMHHLEIFSETEIDDEVCAWLKSARETAG